MIEQDFEQISLALSADKNTALCAKHSLEKCHSCDVDFVQLNRLSNVLLQHPTLLCPPPANVITPKIAQLVTATKEEGNVCPTSSRRDICIHLGITFSLDRTNLNRRIILLPSHGIPRPQLLPSPDRLGSPTS
jgi:hypothetical protein